MNIKLTHRRHDKRANGLRWAAALAVAATALSACGSDPSERQAAANRAPAEARDGGDQHAALLHRSEANDRHLENLADSVEDRALALQAQGSDRHLENLADSVEDRALALQAQGSDRHLENLAEAGQR